MGKRFFTEEIIKKRHEKKLLQEGGYVAEVEVELLYSEEGWSPYLSHEDAQKLDQVRQALLRGDINEASKHARVFTLTPVAI